MASGLQDGVLNNVKKQLALAVDSIQWSYAIFWSISSSQPLVLEWGHGHYNGDIKTRKTCQATEPDLSDAEMSVHRSEELRDLYSSLLAAESSKQATRFPALSPEDLTDTEWYYLLCMSFVFNIGQGLPGNAFENGECIWISNADVADAKVFSRSLLAKSASIQTVVCFPFLGGVVELGVTKMVMEDNSLIQHIKASFLEIPFPIAFKNAKAIPSKTGNVCNGLEMSYSPSWQLLDDGYNNNDRTSVTSSEFPSESVVENGEVDYQSKDSKPISVHLSANDLHYLGVLSTLQNSPHHFTSRLSIQTRDLKSSFERWKDGRQVSFQNRSGRTSHKLLKKILLEVPVLHNERFSTSRSLVPPINKDDKVLVLDNFIKGEKKADELESCTSLQCSETGKKGNLKKTMRHHRLSKARVFDKKHEIDDIDEVEKTIINTTLGR